MRALVLVLLAAAGACRPAVVTPAPDADAQASAQAANTDPSGCEAACANLARLRCPEGIDPGCAAACRHALEIADMKTGCLADAGDPDAARACGSLGPSGCLGR